MTKYNQNASPEEKLQTLFNDRNVLRKKDEATTFSTFAQSEENQSRGRFYEEHKNTIMTAFHKTHFPKLPADHWSNQGVLPDEPPLGFVDEAPVVGEAHEVQESIERLKIGRAHV